MSCQADAANAHSRWRRELAERYAVGYRQVSVEDAQGDVTGRRPLLPCGLSQTPFEIPEVSKEEPSLSSTPERASRHESP